MHSYLDLTISQSLKMAARICKYFCKGYGPSFMLNLLDFTRFRSTSLLKDINKLFKLPVISGQPTPAPDVLLLAPSITKYIKEDLQCIFKTILEAQTPAPILITFPENPQERFLKICFPDVYRGKNHLDCYNFCLWCKDHFAIARAKYLNQIFFPTFFLRNCINFC